MQNKYSKLALLIIAILFCTTRLIYTDYKATLPIKIITWDCLGYYMYLPATIIYNDLKQLKFYDSIEAKYALQGDATRYQFKKLQNGNYVGRYYIGTAILQLPFFLTAHFLATINQQKADGFSSYYQISIAWGAIIWCFISLIYLRKFLLNYFSDKAVAISLLLAIAGTNALQYIAMEGAHVHAWIFPLYVYILCATKKYYEHKSFANIFRIAIIIGLAIICRPTEAIIIFIPFLWEYKKSTYIVFIKSIRKHLVFATLVVLSILFIQCYYWFYVTGSFVHDVGSKWAFLNPYWRVLIGPEKGWLIYTPLCFLFLVGLKYLKPMPFKTAVITFTLLNIYIIISWNDWQYGASYSTRALVQATPIMILPMTAVVQKILSNKFKYLFLVASFYFLVLNCFQVGQYNRVVLHYNRNTFEYYKRIYWQWNSTEEDKLYLLQE